MTKPKTAQPDTRRRRASTGAMMDRIMGLARRLPLTRQVLADQLETATPAQTGVHARVDERRDRFPGTFQTRAAAQAGRVPPIQGARRLRLDTPALPRRLRAAGIGIPRLRRAHGGRGHVRPSRHRQDPPGHRAGPAGLPGGRTDPVLHRRRARHATTARQRGEQARPGARHGSAGPGSWSSTSSDTSRSTRKAAASCSRSPPTRTKDRASSTPPTSSSADGAGSSATPTRHAACQSTAPSTTAG